MMAGLEVPKERKEGLDWNHIFGVTAFFQWLLALLRHKTRLLQNEARLQDIHRVLCLCLQYLHPDIPHFK